MNQRLLLASIMALFLLQACDGGKAAGPAAEDTTPGPDLAEDTVPGLDAFPDAAPDSLPDTTADALPDIPPLPPMSPATCGQEPYEWLAADQVGEVLLWEESAMTNVTPAFLKETLGEMGYDKLEGLDHSVRNFKMRYTTQDKGAALEVTGMVGVPSDVSPDETLPILLWLHPTMGLNDSCAPSRDPLAGPGQTSILSSLGYITVAPDYIGMIGFGEGSPVGSIHPYLVAQPTAIASLDAVRAAIAQLAEDPDLPNGDPSRVVLWGASQGGHACFVTERYQPYYAPELDIVAVAAAIPGTDLLEQAAFGAVHWSDTSEALAGVLIALWNWYGVGELAAVLTDEEPNFIASSALAVALEDCGAKALFSGLDSVDDVYTEPFRAAAADGTLGDLPDFGCFLRESSVDRMSVTRVSNTPFFVSFGELDDLVQTDIELDAMARYCAQGYRIEHLTCAGMDHVEAGVGALHYMARWTKARLDGEEWSEDVICVSEEPIDCDNL